MICGEAVSVNRDNVRGHVATLTCKRWSCEQCRPSNRWKVIKKGAAGNPNVMLTLTVNPANYSNMDDAARDMKRGLVALWKAMAREKGLKKLPYLAVFEKTKAGTPHLHLIMRAPFISHKWLKQTWSRLTGSFVVWINVIQPGRGAYYVAKYLGKDPHAFKGCKRWWRSHNYNQEAEKEDKPSIQFFGRSWERIDRKPSDYLAFLVERGAQITKVNGLHFFEMPECYRTRLGYD